MIIPRLVNGVVVFRSAGPCDGPRLSSALENYYREHDTRDVIWDLRAGQLSDFAATEFEAVARTSAKCAIVRGTGARSAFVVDTEIDELLVQAFVGVAGRQSPIAFQVFRNINAAWDWLSPSE